MWSTTLCNLSMWIFQWNFRQQNTSDFPADRYVLVFAQTRRYKSNNLLCHLRAKNILLKMMDKSSADTMLPVFMLKECAIHDIKYLSFMSPRWPSMLLSNMVIDDWQHLCPVHRGYTPHFDIKINHALKIDSSWLPKSWSCPFLSEILALLALTKYHAIMKYIRLQIHFMFSIMLKKKTF